MKNPLQDSIADILKSKFDFLDDSMIKGILDTSNYRHCLAGQVLIKEGDNTQDVFLLISGRLAISKEQTDGTQIKINEISRGEFFGEMAILSGQKRSTTVTCQRDSVLLEISGDKFQELLFSYPVLYQHLNQVLIQRLASTNTGSTNSSIAQSVGVISVGRFSNATSFSENIVGSFPAKYNTLHLDPNLIKEKLGVDLSVLNQEDSSLKISRWISELETKYDMIFLSVDAENFEWCQFVLRHCDKLFWVGEMSDSFELQKIESQVADKFNITIPQYLILNSSIPPIEGTGNWLDERPNLTGHFHIQGKADYKRLIRFLTNSSIQLILGGGGAKGMAHLGVLKALKELEIPVDYVAGTSIGSIMAALCAANWDLDDAITQSYEAFVKSNPLNDYHFPWVSLLKGQKLNSLLKSYFEDMKIEDLYIPYFSVASNFSEAKMEIMDRGPIWEAVRASISLPTILPPFVKGNSLLLDGGIVDNLPLDPMSKLTKGHTIGVDLSKIKKRTLDYNEIPSNSKIFTDKILGRRKIKVPNIFQIVMGTLTLASDEKRKANQSKFDLYLEPDVGKFGFMAWKDFHKILEEGHNHSLSRLSQWKETLDL